MEVPDTAFKPMVVGWDQLRCSALVKVEKRTRSSGP